MKNEEQARSLFGISLSDRPRWKQFLICSSGFFFGYLVNGICEEYVYNRLQFSYGWYFTFVQGWVYILLIYLQGFTPKQMVNPWKTYVKLSAVLMGSNGLTKGSLAFLNYPAQLMFKSTKVLPVMVMGAFIPGLKRKYPPHEYLSAVLLVVGLILFTLADAHTSPNFSVIGVLMVSGALVMDAFLGNLQEAIFTMNPGTTQTEMLFCSTLVGMPFLIPPMLFTGELFKAWNSCSKHPYVYGVLVFEAMATFIGQVSVLSRIALFGAATTAMEQRGYEKNQRCQVELCIYWRSFLSLTLLIKKDYIHELGKPPPLECTTFKLEEEVKFLKQLAIKLHSVDEFTRDCS